MVIPLVAEYIDQVAVVCSIIAPVSCFTLGSTPNDEFHSSSFHWMSPPHIRPSSISKIEPQSPRAGAHSPHSLSTTLTTIGSRHSIMKTLTRSVSERSLFSSKAPTTHCS